MFHSTYERVLKSPKNHQDVLYVPINNNNRGFLTGKLAHNRRIYLSTHYTTAQLPEAVHHLLLKNNTKIKRDRNTVIEQEARNKLKQLIKASSTAP